MHSSKISTASSQILVWLDIAISDLASCKHLYSIKQYRTSYFLFQQAVEKANKAFALFGGQSENDVFKAGHDQFEIYKKGIRKSQAIVGRLLTMLDAFPKAKDHDFFHQLKLPEFVKRVEDSVMQIGNMKNIDLVNIPTLQIHELLDALYEVEELITDHIPNSMFNDMPSFFNDAASWVQEFNPTYAKELQKEYRDFIEDKENIKMLQQGMRNIIRLSFKLDFIGKTFFVCSIFTIQHSSRTRYPRAGENPLETYNKRLPLVQQQAEIMEVFENAVRRFKRIINRPK